MWGFPKKRAYPKLAVEKDTLTGVLDYAGQRIATGTMAYKYREIAPADALRSLSKMQSNLKIIPDYDFGPKIAQIQTYQLRDIEVREMNHNERANERERERERET